MIVIKLLKSGLQQNIVSFADFTDILIKTKDMNSTLLYSSVFIIALFLTTPSFSQQDKYLSNEKDITISQLAEKADATDFKVNFVAEIYQDEKNTYFAINNSNIESRYVKLRLLEQIFSDNTIVSISSSLQNSYLLFLTNNTVINDQKPVIDMFQVYYSIAIKEEASMNEEDMTHWLIKHDKYKKK